MTIDKRFALLADNENGSEDVLYPYQKHQQATGRNGFAATTPEHGQDRHSGGYYTTDLREVIQGVLFKGWGIRAKAVAGGTRVREGTFKLGERAVSAYWLAPEFRYLATGAEIQPRMTLPERKPAFGNNAKEPVAVQLKAVSAADFVAAFEAVAPRATDRQLSMLVGHAAATDAILSMQAIAALGRYDEYSAANIQYGKLARLFAEYFHISGLENYVEVLAEPGSLDVNGHWQWKLRPALVDALTELGHVETPCSEFGAAQAVAEVDADPQSLGVPETTRLALANARIGQGGYRKRMLRLWGGQCAISECSLTSVLVASHAKSWALSSNIERLDEFNGLILAASIDRLFDVGLIGFADDGGLLHKALPPAELQAVGLASSSRLRFVHERHRPFLAAHRRQHGFE
ncbi:HNH endonuclease [Paraburkholderia phenoliruptrix]|uniref:HNH endonuclease n=1 Tax=Paraburkholderia phenoliruptrix TaxID=252970 RepID=UPI0028699F96|nr:HNH endonuclease signature motif containing protein [Paraburkholderia phenoliruptrix]WMY08104.1 HNH endonuclease signature motif containing protein [Paraburkholderia phenoliruptrix]